MDKVATRLSTREDIVTTEYESHEYESEEVKSVDKEQILDFKDDEEIKVELDEDLAKPVSFLKLFSYATCFDIFLIVIGVFSAIAVGVTLPLFSVLLSDLFNDFGRAPPEDDDDFFQTQAAETSIFFGILAASSFILGFFQVGCFTISAERQTLRIQETYLQAVLNQEIAWFDERQAGELSSKIAENTVVIKEAISDKLSTTIQFIITFFASFAVALYFDYQLALVLCASLPLIALGGFMMIKAFSALSSDGLGSYTKAGAIVEEALTNIRTVTAFNAQNSLLRKYEKLLKTAEKAGIKKQYSVGLGLGFVMGVMFLTYALGFYYGAVRIEDDRIAAFDEFSFVSAECQAIATNLSLSELDFCSSADIILESIGSPVVCDCGCSHPDADCLNGGDVILIFFSIVIGGFSLGQAAPGISAFQNGRIAAGKIFSVINRKPSIVADTKKPDASLPDITGRIMFEQVAFSYPTRSEVKIFEDLNLTIEEGKSTALVGGSGCGKSTIMQLLQRFYDPDSGSVFVQDSNEDVHNLKDLDLALFRNMIGLVSQEPVLFATTIYKNIAYGARLRHEPTEEEVIAAAKAANAYDFIMGFPNGFETKVGEQGAQLSGGQKQRIAIARALIRDPTILLLDEATSALDNESERIVQKALDKLLVERSRTTVVIAHRLSTIRNCDKIVVVGEGRVLEEGDHESLLGKENGMYNMLVNAANKTQEKDGAEENLNKIISKKASQGDVRAARLLSTASGGVDEMIPSAVEIDQSAVKELMENETNAKKKDNEENEEEGEEAKEKPYKVSITRVFRLSKPEALWFLPAIIGSALVGSQMPFFAILIADIITALFEVESEELRDEANKFALYFVFLSLVAFTSNFTQSYCFGYISEKLTTRIRLLLFSTLLRQEIGFFDEEENSIGALSAGLATDAALVKAVVSDRLGLVVINLTTVIMGFTIAFINGWELTLVMLGLLPLIVIGGIFEMLAFTQAAHSDSKHMKPAAATLQESIAGVRTVTAFNAKDRVVELFTEALDGPRRTAKKKGLIVGIGYGYSQAMQFTMYAIAFYVGAIFIDRGIFNFNQLLTVFFAVMMVGIGIGQGAALAPDAAKGGVAVSNVFKLLDRKSKIDPNDEDGLFDLDSKEYNFTLDDVSFNYPARPDVKIFKNLDLKIPGGSTVALVGTSGSGKSTIISLIERFYDPDEGDILVADGTSLKAVNLKWWRSQLGLVEQEPKLFAISIKDNIKMGVDEEEVSDERVIAAAKSANAHDFIMAFPNGYDTLVGDQGAQLSGGQKQRVCIARAIIKEPKVLLLDEATSALDNKSEKIVQEALDNLLAEKQMTTVVIAHRLTTIKNADMIVVMAHGEVIETGNHDELLAQKGQYYKLWNTQKNK